MRFIESKLNGAWIIEPEPHEDERGFFARTFCAQEFMARGLNPRVVQCDVSFNNKKGTLRGLHYQVAPYEEVKLVRCTRGAIYDVIIDLRPDSPTSKGWIAVILKADDAPLPRLDLPDTVPLYRPIPRATLYVPQGFAHGFQTLEDNTEVFYQMSEFYHPECARGVRWDDPAFEIKYPRVERRIISEKDLKHSLWKP